MVLAFISPDNLYLFCQVLPDRELCIFACSFFFFVKKKTKQLLTRIVTFKNVFPVIQRERIEILQTGKYYQNLANCLAVVKCPINIVQRGKIKFWSFPDYFVSCSWLWYLSGWQHSYVSIYFGSACFVLLVKPITFDCVPSRKLII